MRKPRVADVTEDDGSIDYEAYDEAMGDYEDSVRDREEIEEKWGEEGEEEE